MNPEKILSQFFFFIKNPHHTRLNSLTFKHQSGLHANARLKWEPSLTRNAERGKVISASLHGWDRKYYSIEEVAAAVAKAETNNGSDLKLQEESNHAHLTHSITLPHVLAISFVPSQNLPVVMIGTWIVLKLLKGRTMKFLRNSPIAEVMRGPLKDSISAVEKVAPKVASIVQLSAAVMGGPLKDSMSEVEKVAPKWVSEISSIVLLSAVFFGRFRQKEPMDAFFKDFIGMDAVISDFQSMLSVLPPNISVYKGIGQKVPNGFLVCGPPRTGKTTLVHALAKKSRLPFFPVYASDIAKIGKQEIERLFDDARSCSPSIILIENIEFIAAKRESGGTDPILMELKNQTDGCINDGKKVAVIATTDKRDKLDLVMTTGGWFSHLVHVPRPDADGRRKMVNHLLKDSIRDEDKDPCNLIVVKTEGLVWGNIEHICSLVSRFATKRGDTYVTKEDVERAFQELAKDAYGDYAQL